MRSIGEDEPSTTFLRAYQLANIAQSLHAQNPRHWEAREGSLEQINRGLSILQQRLASEYDSCSDQTIQAVLIVFVYATNFQTSDEAASHRTALQKMIDLRGGLTSFGHNVTLRKQLECYASGRFGEILHVNSGQGPGT